MTYAEINNNVVVQLVEVIEGKSIEDYFHPSLLHNFISLGNNPENVGKGFIYEPITGVFSAPE